ncbi:MAG: DUF4954 family protein, partial [Cyclobacteriaceae bacterium]|nr:DUF4954 family protein [Cyclobacteriaceae bacterium]
MFNVKTDLYRPLTNHEIGQMVLQGCQCDNWNDIHVHTDFQPEYVQQTRFSGQIRLGRFTENISLFGGITFHTGIYNATIHNCIIGDDVFIHNV